MSEEKMEVRFLSETGTNFFIANSHFLMEIESSPFNPDTAAEKRHWKMIQKMRMRKTWILRPFIFLGWLSALVTVEYLTLWMILHSRSQLVLMLGAYDMAAEFFIGLAFLGMLWDWQATVTHKGKKY